MVSAIGEYIREPCGLGEAGGRNEWGPRHVVVRGAGRFVQFPEDAGRGGNASPLPDPRRDKLRFHAGSAFSMAGQRRRM